MKAIAVIPGRPDSLHKVEIPEPRLNDVSIELGILVSVLKVGLEDGTDREIASGKYGVAPTLSDFLVLGHENLGRVEEVGHAVTGFAPGDYVVCMVRGHGQSIYDMIGLPDMSTDQDVKEHGIKGLHGFLTERYVDLAKNLLVVPAAIKEVGVLLEPTSVVEKGITQAYEVQRRLRVWAPHRAAVLGAGTIGLLATLLLRLKGLEVTTLALQEPPFLNAELVEALGASYVSTKQESLAERSRRFGPFDMIFEATGYSPTAFEAMSVLAKNGVLVLSSVTGGHRRLEVPADVINLSLVLGNNVIVGTVNASRDHYEAAVRDVALAESQFPGWLARLITHRVAGLDSYREAFRFLDSRTGTIKVVIEVGA